MSEYQQHSQETSSPQTRAGDRAQLSNSQWRTQNPLYLPRWSLAAMFVVVLVLVVAIVAIIVAQRAAESAPAGDPVIQVVSARDTLSQTQASSDEIDATAGPGAGGVEIIISAVPSDNLTIDGPLLPTVSITSTPVFLSVGATVEVAGVGGQELNIRNKPGLTDSTILFRAAEGTAYEVIDGPQEADGFSWWQVRDTQFQVQGWAVANYLRVVQ